MLEYGRFYLELGTHLSEKGGGGGIFQVFSNWKHPKKMEMNLWLQIWKRLTMEYLHSIAAADVYLVVTLLSQKRSNKQKDTYSMKPSRKSEWFGTQVGFSSLDKTSWHDIQLINLSILINSVLNMIVFYNLRAAFSIQHGKQFVSLRKPQIRVEIKVAFLFHNIV